MAEAEEPTVLIHPSKTDGVKIEMGVEYVEAWVCDQPPLDARYQVLRDVWVDQPADFGHPIRLVYEIKLTEVA